MKKIHFLNFFFLKKLKKKSVLKVYFQSTRKKNIFTTSLCACLTQNLLLLSGALSFEP